MICSQINFTTESPFEKRVRKHVTFMSKHTKYTLDGRAENFLDFCKTIRNEVNSPDVSIDGLDVEGLPRVGPTPRVGKITLRAAAQIRR